VQRFITTVPQQPVAPVADKDNTFIRTYSPNQYYDFVEKYERKVLDGVLVPNGQDNKPYIKPQTGTGEFSEEIFLNNVTSFNDFNAYKAFFDFDRADVLYPPSKFNDVEAWLKAAVKEGNNNKAGRYRYMLLTGRSGDGKTFAANYLAAKGYYVVFLRDSVVKDSLEAAIHNFDPSPFSYLLHAVNAHLIVLNDLIDKYGKEIATPLLYLNAIRNGNNLVESARQKSQLSSIHGLVNLVMQKTNNKIVFFVDEAHGFAQYYKNKIKRTSNTRQKGKKDKKGKKVNALTVLARILSRMAPTIYASTIMSSYTFGSYVSGLNLCTAHLLISPGSSSQPANEFVNKFMAIVGVKDQVYYNSLLKYTPVRAQTWIMMQFFLLASQKEAGYLKNPDNVSQLLHSAIRHVFMTTPDSFLFNISRSIKNELFAIVREEIIKFWLCFEDVSHKGTIIYEQLGGNEQQAVLKIHQLLNDHVRNAPEKHNTMLLIRDFLNDMSVGSTSLLFAGGSKEPDAVNHTLNDPLYRYYVTRAVRANYGNYLTEFFSRICSTSDRNIVSHKGKLGEKLLGHVLMKMASTTEPITENPLFSDFKNTYLNKYTLQVQSIDFGSLKTYAAYVHFGLTDQIAIALEQEAGIDVFCSLVPLDKNSQEELIPLSFSVKFGTSAGQLKNALAGFQKANVWKQFSGAKQHIAKKKEWESKLKMRHSTTRSVRIAFSPFTEYNSIAKFNPTNKKAQVNPASVGHIKIVWHGSTFLSEVGLSSKLIEAAKAAFESIS